MVSAVRFVKTPVIFPHADGFLNVFDFLVFMISNTFVVLVVSRAFHVVCFSRFSCVRPVCVPVRVCMCRSAYSYTTKPDSPPSPAATEELPAEKSKRHTQTTQTPNGVQRPLGLMEKASDL